MGVICCTPVTLGQGRLTTTGTGAQLTSSARAEVMWAREQEAEAALYTPGVEADLSLSHVSSHRHADRESSRVTMCVILMGVMFIHAFKMFPDS